jgi:SAP domain
MPRAKRALAEADPNASAPAPAAKKASSGKASSGTVLGKENQPFKSKTVAELSSMLKERGLPHTGKKGDLVRRLEETTKTISRAEKATSSKAADSHEGSGVGGPH